MDGIEQFKANQKVVWATFAQLENVTATAAPHLVRFAGVRAGIKVLDFGPEKKVFENLDANDPAKAATLRREIEALAEEYFEENRLRQDFLLTRAVKA